MRHQNIDKRLTDGALERVMRDVLNGMQAFSAGLAKPVGPDSPLSLLATDSETHPLPRFTSLRSVDMFGSRGEAEKSTRIQSR